MCISGRGLSTYQIRPKSEKLFVDIRTYGWTDTPDFSKSIRSSPGDDLKIKDGGRCHVELYVK